MSLGQNCNLGVGAHFRKICRCHSPPNFNTICAFWNFPSPLPVWVFQINHTFSLGSRLEEKKIGSFSVKFALFLKGSSALFIWLAHKNMKLRGYTNILCQTHQSQFLKNCINYTYSSCHKPVINSLCMRFRFTIIASPCFHRPSFICNCFWYFMLTHA